MRTILYFWISVEFISLAQLYYIGYKNHKKSKVIGSLQKLLLTTGFMFGVLTLMPIVTLTDGILGNSIRNLLILFSLPVLYYIRQFRKWSLSSSEMKLPEKK